MLVKIEDAKQTLLNLFREGIVVFISWSGGKDSSVCALLTLLAAKEAAAEGLSPVVVASTSNTRVENPEVDNHVRAELAKMRKYGERNGFKVTTKVVTPNLSSTWQVKVLTGRGLPSFPGTNTDCAVDLKVEPQRVYRNKLFKDIKKKGMPKPVIILGTRYDESARRATNMTQRNESATAPVCNDTGELILSPIAHWSTDDVWELIGMAASGMVETYSDFAETKRIYAHSESSSCAVVADAISSGKKRGGCGTRTGCFVCQQAEDKSLENMIAYDTRYSYAAGLVKFNKFLRATRYDWSLRHWLGRTIRGGFIAIKPDTYHPSMQRALFRYMLQLDFDEQTRAAEKGERPMFHLLPIDMIVAIDSIWSLNGFAPSFAVWADYRDIFQRGIRYGIPDIEPVPETPMPEARYVHVGTEWDGDHAEAFTGMRSAYTEALTELSPCQPELRTTPDGRSIWDVNTNTSFSVDMESACMLLDFELDSMLAKYDAGTNPGGVTSGYKFYLQYGALNLSHSQALEHDYILRRTEFKDRLGLSYEYDIADLLAKSIDGSEMPAAAQAEWKVKQPIKIMRFPQLPGKQLDMFDKLAA